MGCQRHSLHSRQGPAIYAVPCPDGYVLLGNCRDGVQEAGPGYPWATLYFLGYMPSEQAFNPNAPFPFQDHLRNCLPPH